MTPPPSRLQIAANIQQLLKKELGYGIVVEQMLAHERYARDVLLVCDALREGELPALAAAFRDASQRLERRPQAVPGHARQPTDWARDTSGFGVGTVPPREEPAPPAAEPGTERRRGWTPWRRG